MLWFRNRKKWNGGVDTIVTRDLGIQTRGNEKFPGVLAYLELLDTAYSVKMNEREAALYIGVLYFSGLFRNNFWREAEDLRGKLVPYGQEAARGGQISIARWRKFLGEIDKVRSEVPRTPIPPKFVDGGTTSNLAVAIARSLADYIERAGPLAQTGEGLSVLIDGEQNAHIDQPASFPTWLAARPLSSLNIAWDLVAVGGLVRQREVDRVAIEAAWEFERMLGQHQGAEVEHSQVQPSRGSPEPDFGPSDEYILASEIASTLHAFIQVEGTAEFFEERLSLVIDEDFQASIADTTHFPGIASIPLHALPLTKVALLVEGPMRTFEVANIARKVATMLLREDE